MKKTAHIISHTHWDREWYLPYETHHMMLNKNNGYIIRYI